MEVLNVSTLDVRSKPLVPQTVAGSGEFLPNCVTGLGGWIYGKMVSQPLLPISMLVFLIQLMGKSHSKSFHISWLLGLFQLTLKTKGNLKYSELENEEIIFTPPPTHPHSFR